MVKWTPKSEEDLEEILEHIAKNFNVDLAIQTIDEIVDYVESVLSANPLAGAVFESNPLFSKLIYSGNSIFYCENPSDRHIYIVYVQPRSSLFQNKRINKSEVA